MERSSHFAELLTPQLTEAFYLGFSDDGRRASLIDQVYGRPPAGRRGFEEYLGVGVFGSDGWNFEDTGRVQYDERAKGFLKRFTHVEFAKGFLAERKFVDDNNSGVFDDDARGLGDAAFRKREKGAASVFINAFTDSGVNDDGMPIAGPDAVGLCSTAHPLSTDDPSVTQSNESTLALTAENLGATRQLHMALTDDRGDLMNVMPDLVLLPPELEDVAIAAGMSPLEPDSANNAVNPQRGRFRYLVWHYLTDANAWFMIDSARRNRSLLWFDRIPLEFGRDSDFDTFTAKFNAYMRYSYGWRDWAWIYGQNPS
jgi:hypothetical protein